MKTLTDAVTGLIDNPRPVLCLDTCVFLDIIRTGERDQVDSIKYFWNLFEVITTSPERVQLMITWLVLCEWEQNQDEVINSAIKWLNETDQRIKNIHTIREHIGQPLPDQAPAYSGLELHQSLLRLAESLLSNASVLEKDGACVLRAVGRVESKRRPSHKKEVKDSIHLEHYLELARGLTKAGFNQPVVFVSTNKKDFWAEKVPLSNQGHDPKEPHDDLANELAEVNLRFFGNLVLGLRHLGLLSGNIPPPPVGA